MSLWKCLLNKKTRKWMGLILIVLALNLSRIHVFLAIPIQGKFLNLASFHGISVLLLFFFVCLLGLMIYAPVNSNGHVWINHTFFLDKLGKAVNQYFVHILSLVTDKLALLYNFTRVYTNIPSCKRDESQTSFPLQERIFKTEWTKWYQQHFTLLLLLFFR